MRLSLTGIPPTTPCSPQLGPDLPFGIIAIEPKWCADTFSFSPASIRPSASSDDIAHGKETRFERLSGRGGYASPRISRRARVCD